MIVGNGMIAKSLVSIDRDDLVFFASGVSNSMCINEDQYNREINLLNDNIDKSKKLIYFSSIDEYIINDRYLRHKKEIQSIIEDNTENFIIIKIPQLIGKSGNSNNFINYIYNNIKNDIAFDLFLTKRSLLDIEDLVNIINSLINLNFKGIFNINYIELEFVTNYIKIIENILDKKSKINKKIKIDQIINKNDEFVTDIINKNINNLNNYNIRVIQKYYNK